MGMARRRKITKYDTENPSKLPLFLKGVLLIEGIVFISFIALAFIVILLIIKSFFLI